MPAVTIDLPAILRAMVRTDSLPALAACLTGHIASSRSIVLARVWFKAGEALSLTSSAGTPSGGGSYNRLDGEFRQMAVADSKIEEIATTLAPFVVRSVRGDEDWLTNSSWAARQGVRAFLAFPLVADRKVLGVVAVLDRQMPDDDLLERLMLVSEIAAYRAAELSRRAGPSAVPPEVGSREALPSPLVGDGGACGGRRSPEVLTRADLRRIEKENIEAALARTGGKVFGTDGAAALLGMRPTTLASRVKALGIR